MGTCQNVWSHMFQCSAFHVQSLRPLSRSSCLACCTVGQQLPYGDLSSDQYIGRHVLIFFLLSLIWGACQSYPSRSCRSFVRNQQKRGWSCITHACRCIRVSVCVYSSMWDVLGLRQCCCACFCFDLLNLLAGVCQGLSSIVVH